jgi:hypothetical protein
MTLNVIQDYTIGTISPSSQTINPGQSAGYNLSILPVGASYDGSVTLKCAITPTFAGSCSFSPNPVMTGSGNVVMTVTSQAPSGQIRIRVGLWLYAPLALLPGIVFVTRHSRSRSRQLLLSAIVMLVFLLPSCGGGSNGGGGGGGGGGTNPGTYTITVTGTPPSITQTVPPTTTLIVQ